MRGGVHAEVFSTVIKNTRARREFAGDPRSSFLQQFPRELQHSLSLVPVNESAEKITLRMPGQ